MIYLAPRYVEVDAATFAEYEAITLRYGGSADPLRFGVAGWLDDLSFTAGSRGAIPDTGDKILLNSGERVDGFTADGRHFVLYES